MEEEIALARPVSRLYCRQRYCLTEGLGRNKGLISMSIITTIVEEGHGSRRGRLKSYNLISYPMIEGNEREGIFGFLTRSGIREEDAGFIITSMSCFASEIALKCQSLEGWGCLALYMNILVSVDHYENIQRGIKVDQGVRIIKVDQYNGVCDSDSLIVDQEEDWDNLVLFNIEADNTMNYTLKQLT